MQRARSSHGQVALSTQSVADIAAATGNEQLLASLTDNFTGFFVHRQTSPESRDWLAMLFGTRELWQTTDRTGGSGARTDTAAHSAEVERRARRDEDLGGLGAERGPDDGLAAAEVLEVVRPNDELGGAAA